MFNKRLMKVIPDAMKHVKINVLLQIIALVSNIIIILTIANFLRVLFNNEVENIFPYLAVIIIFIILRVILNYYANKESFKASEKVKTTLRVLIYEKIVKLEENYAKKYSTAELLQVSVEGVEQLEIYFANYLPQFFYSMIAPLILFTLTSFINIKVAIVLFIFVPLIPISIMLIQKVAKRILAKYLGEYATLADNFLELVQGMNTLKIYSSDEEMHKKMNKQAENFRRVTMKVLSMQLNSIIVMDIVAYGGAALGIILALNEFSSGSINLFQVLVIILLAFEFFLPLRILGSFFHVAMNGIASSKKIFKLLDLEDVKTLTIAFENGDIEIENMSFSYGDNEVLSDINIKIKKNSFVSFVGRSGSGKSTLASILTGLYKDYKGSVSINSIDVNSINRISLLNNVTLVSTNSHLFKGSVRENLLLANSNLSDDELLKALSLVNLREFFESEQGLDTLIQEKASNLSGGQAQRLSIARAVLHDTNIYIFDEATSNIDAESEEDIMKVIQNLKKTKTVLLISHRLANVVSSDTIYVLENGKLVEEGSHIKLLENESYYKKLWKTQRNLEISEV